MSSIIARFRKTSPPRNPRLQLPWVGNNSFHKQFQAFGVSAKEIRRLYKLGERCETTSTLYDRPIVLTSPFWYLHGLKEIFADESYRFNAASPTPFILDCGANIGLSLIYFKRQYPAARIVAFEPDETQFTLLQKNAAGLPGMISLVPKAVWINNGTLHFRSDQSVGGSLVLTAEEQTANQVREVNTVRLRDYLTQPVDLLKIDIEGAEFAVLNDCRDHLGWVDHLFIEYHSLPRQPQQLSELLSILTNAGFRFYLKEAWENMTHPFMEKNGIFYDLQLNIFAYRAK